VDDKVLQNRTGKWYLTIMNLTRPMPKADLEARKPIDKSTITLFTSDYALRTWITGCYFYNPITNAWVADGLEVPKRLHRKLGLCYTRASLPE
jgi:hypothetical protein